MNTHAVGIEAANDGVGQPWPQVQIDAYFAINNALAAAYGLQPTDCCTHEAWAPGRKVDLCRVDVGLRAVDAALGDDVGHVVARRHTQ